MVLEGLCVPRDQLSFLGTWLYFGAPMARKVVDWDGEPRFYWHVDPEYFQHHGFFEGRGSAIPVRDLRAFLERARAHLSGPPRAAESMGIVESEGLASYSARFHSGWERTWLALRELAESVAERQELLPASVALHPAGDRAWLALVLAGLDEPALACEHARSVTAPADRIWMRWLVEGRNGAALADALEPGRYAPRKGSLPALQSALRGDWREVLAAVPANAEVPFWRMRRWGPNRLLSKLDRLHLGDPVNEAELRVKFEDFLGHTGVFGTEVPAAWSLSATSVSPYAELYRAAFEPELLPLQLFPRIARMAGFTGSTVRVLCVQPEVLATLGTLLDWLATLPEDAAVSVSTHGPGLARLDHEPRSAISGSD